MQHAGRAGNGLVREVDLVAVEYHMFIVVDPARFDGQLDAAIDDATNGLVGASADTAVITTGVQMADVSCEVLVLDAELSGPTVTDLRDWDEIMDVSITTTTGHLYVDAVDDEAPNLPNLCSRGPGAYRMRVHARGRDSHTSQIVTADPTTTDAPESYRITTWPAPTAPLTIHQTRDHFGQALRDSINESRDSH